MGAISSLFGYLLNALYSVFNNYGIAIIVFSIILRLILIPITIKQQKAMKKSAELQEEMKEIQRKYKNNPEKLNQETIELYKREKMSPFTGCLSSILQIIIILSVFFLVSRPLTYMKKVDPQIIEDYTKEIQESGEAKTAYNEIAIIEQKGGEDPQVYINMEFLGLDLSKVPTQSLNDWRVYVIPGLYIISSVLSIKLTMYTQKKEKQKKEIIVQDGEQKNAEPDPMEQMNKTMMYMMPIMSVTIAIVAPLGLALYWFISNILIIIERLIINKIMAIKENKEGKENA